MGRKVIRNKPSTLSGGVLRKIKCNTAAVCAGFIISSAAVFVFVFTFFYLSVDDLIAGSLKFTVPQLATQDKTAQFAFLKTKRRNVDFRSA